MLVEIDLLDYLAYQMGCGILSDLRLFQCKRAQFSQKTRFLCQRCDGCNKMHK